MRVAPKIVLTEEERVELNRLMRSKVASVRLVQRARIILPAADGMQNRDIATLGWGEFKLRVGVGGYAESRFAGIER